MTFSLPLHPAEPLPESEFPRLKDAVLAWARAASQLDVQTLGRKFLIRNADRIPVYDVTLLSLFETRPPELEEVVLPDDEPSTSADRAGGGEEMVAGRQPGNHAPMAGSLNVWDYPSETRTDFKEHRASYPIPATRRVRDCYACVNKGDVLCDRCHGNGYTPCAVCHASGQAPCDFCKGQAKTNCLKCDGRGLVRTAMLMTKESDACPDCKGAGKIPCARCTNGTFACVMCSATGRRSCDKCAGRGNVACDACRGKGRLLVALAFRAEFKPFSTAGAAAVDSSVPRKILDKALLGKKPEGETDLPAGGLTDAEVSAADLPDPLRALLRDLLSRLAPMLSFKTRVVRQKISLARADLVRLAGTVFDQEFVYWITPDLKNVSAEKNPLLDLGETAAQSAARAWDARDWANALSLARQALVYHPDHDEARRILREWDRKVFRETALGAAGTALAAAAAAAAFVLREPGVHKARPALHAFAALLACGTATSFAWKPLARRLYAGWKRAGASVVLTLAVLAGAAAAAKVGFRWDGVRAADQAALAEEIKVHFPSGFSEVYWEPDLEFLESLAGRYKDSRADTSALTAALGRQRELKVKRGQLQAEFQAKLTALLQAAPEAGLDRTRTAIIELRDISQLQSIDVSAAEAALKNLAEQVKRAAEERPRGHISITRVPAPEEKESPPAPRPTVKTAAKQSAKTAAKPSAKPAPSKSELKALAKAMEKDIKAVVKAKPPLSVAQQKSRLQTLRKTYLKKGADVGPIDKALKNLKEPPKLSSSTKAKKK